MIQWLRVYITLAENLSSVPFVMLEGSHLLTNPVPGDLALSSGLCRYCTQLHNPPYTKLNFKNL